MLHEASVLPLNDRSLPDRKEPPSQSEPPAGSSMHVRKRNGRLEPVDVNKIVRAVQRSAGGLPHVDIMRIAVKTIGGLFDGATTRELDQLSIQTAASLIAEEPEYSQLAARLLDRYIAKEVTNQDIHSFSQAVAVGHRLGLVAAETARFVAADSRKLNTAADQTCDLFEYFGLRTVYDRYLLRHPATRNVIETPVYFFLRVACGLSTAVSDALELFDLMASHRYLPSSPTLFNSGTLRPQMSSCYLLDSPADDLEGIYARYADVARLSKYAGGIGLAYHRIRSRGSHILGTNGHSNGVVPWLKTLDSSVAAVNQGGRRKGACAVYLETWHADVEGIPRAQGQRRGRGPSDLQPQPGELGTGPVHEAGGGGRALVALRPQGRAPPRRPSRRGFRFGLHTGRGRGARREAGRSPRPLRADAEDARRDGQRLDELQGRLQSEVEPDAAPGKCCSFLESLHRDRRGDIGGRDGRLQPGLDQPGPARGRYGVRFRCTGGDSADGCPVPRCGHRHQLLSDAGVGCVKPEVAPGGPRPHGPAGRLLPLAAAFRWSRGEGAITPHPGGDILPGPEHLVRAGAVHGPHPTFPETRASEGVFQFDLWETAPRELARWETLRDRIRKFGLRNSLVVAIAPTATIASIVGAFECIEPQISNLFKRETLSGEFLQVNRYLVRELKALGLWTEEIRNRIKLAEGSIQGIAEIPRELKNLFRTVWEIPMRSLVDMAAERAPYIDQSQSLNLFIESPSIGKLSSMYMYAWKKGLKTTYYLRSRPATGIAKTTTSRIVETPKDLSCSLENPETCEACQ